MTCGLQTEGFLHLDIKPSTIFRYKNEKDEPVWKLVDFDGIVRTGTSVRVTDLIYATEYAPPELARSVLKAQRETGRVTLTRSMAVWSIGMLMLEAVALMPIYDLKFSWFQKWRDKEGKNATTFLASVAGEQSRSLGTEKMISQELHEAMKGLHEDMPGLLEGMLAKDVGRRLSIAQCVLHRFFAAQRKEVLEARWRIGDEAALPGEAPEAPAEPEEVIGSDIRAYIKAQLARAAEREAEAAAPRALPEPPAPAADEGAAPRPSPCALM
mmetsp:Transcript_56869/g.157451  ORF Transcript_56869/g.157451 Transcript_56869/m.157451 type:complete len:269 (+) Transcript_56869:2-808(+)